MELIIVRHGITEENEAGIAQGQTDGTLSVKGLEENRLLGEQLKNKSFSCIFTSPLGRAYQTAMAIHCHHPAIPLIQDPRLMERHLGVLQGRAYPDSFSEAALYEGMETVTAMHERLLDFLSGCRNKHRQETIVLVSHGYLIKVLLSVMRHQPVEDFHTIQLMNNSSFILETIADAD